MRYRAAVADWLCDGFCSASCKEPRPVRGFLLWGPDCGIHSATEIHFQTTYSSQDFLTFEVHWFGSIPTHHDCGVE